MVPDRPEKSTITITGRAADGIELADTLTGRFFDIRQRRAVAATLRTSPGR
jgi:hypothetical protein